MKDEYKLEYLPNKSSNQNPSTSETFTKNVLYNVTLSCLSAIKPNNSKKQCVCNAVVKVELVMGMVSFIFKKFVFDC